MSFSSQIAALLNARLAKITTGNALELAFRDALSKQAPRIFEDGKTSAGASIGSYSTKPLYADPNTTPKATNKTGKTGNQIKGGYYAGGYRELRSQQGREAGFKNLRFTNELQSDYANAEISPTSSSVPVPRPTVITPLHLQIRINKPINLVKIKAAEAEAGPIFDLSSSEDKTLRGSYKFNLQKILTGG